ncbi:hypothetical protein H4582DRAFT_1960090 [Lactarius indigo]|nr:hypothetical protein H4582DRAFT_1960090 [Lactarius indigo]
MSMWTQTQVQTTVSGPGSTWYLYRLLRLTRLRGSRWRRWCVLSVPRLPLAPCYITCMSILVSGFPWFEIPYIALVVMCVITVCACSHNSPNNEQTTRRT